MTAHILLRAALAAPLLLAGCNEATAPGAPPQSVGESQAVAPAPSAAPVPSGSSPPPTAAGWDLVSSGEGVALVFPASGTAAIRLFCPARQDRIVVNVPAFRPIPSEERLSFGSGGAAEALVADPRGDRGRGGVSATGAVPRNLGALIAGPVSASYGAQTSGPHPTPPGNLARAFAAACSDGAPRTGATATPKATPTPTPTPTASATSGNVSACLMQDGRRLSVGPLRGVGTEPFWAVKIEGRCVTYMHPEDQQGTRVWTKYTASDGGGTWTGALNGRPFVLRTRAQPGCSDGMSDRRYPIAVALTVGGEQRNGCAAPP